VAAFGGTHGLHFVLLQGAQQLGLQIHGHVANFVQEECTAMGGFQQALLGLNRPVKATFT
jgi:hypothetical protein